MYRIWLTNFFYFMQDEFDDLESAIDKGRSTAFEFAVMNADGMIVAHWDMFRGLRRMNAEGSWE